MRHWLATPHLAPIFRDEVLSLYVANRWLMVSIITQQTQRRNPWYMILGVARTAKTSPACPPGRTPHFTLLVRFARGCD